MSARDQLDCLYALVVCLATGAPWSEQNRGLTWRDFLIKTFGEVIHGCEPYEEQDDEFCCGFPTKSGSNSYVKGKDACCNDRVGECGRIIIAVRNVVFPDRQDSVIYSKCDGNSAAKFWVAFRIPDPVCCRNGLGNNREDPCRQSPAAFEQCVGAHNLKRFKDELRAQVLKRLKGNAEDRSSGRKRGGGAKKAKMDASSELRCMLSLVHHLGVQASIPVKRPSTFWTPDGDPVLGPQDVRERGCSCAQNVPFPTHISEDCLNLGPFNVAKRTRFLKEDDFWPALMHALKGKLLCELRGVSVRLEDVVRITFHEEDLGSASLVCNMEGFIKPQSDEYLPDVDENSTDKGRILWALPMHALEKVGLGAVSRSSVPHRNRHTSSPPSSWSATMLQALYREGTLHVVQCAPRRDYSGYITLEPAAPSRGDYLAIFLNWVGNVAFQHTAIARCAQSETSLGLGILRPLFSIVDKWNGPTHPNRNILKGHFHPDSEAVRNILRRRGIRLSPDQRECMIAINDADNPILKIQAYAGTGKTLLVSLAVEIARDLQVGAIMFATPTRWLRDSILQSAEFLGSVFNESDLGPNVSWLGRPSNAPNSKGMWVDTMRDLVHYSLRHEIGSAKSLEDSVLRPLYEALLKIRIKWDQIRRSTILPGSDAFNAMHLFRKNFLKYMTLVMKIKRRRIEQWEMLLKKGKREHIVVGTMDAFVKWRAGELRGPHSRLLANKEFGLVVLEEFEAYDLPQVVAALSNMKALTVIMVGDTNQRVEHLRSHGYLANFTQIEDDRLIDDGETYNRTNAEDTSVPEQSVTSGMKVIPESRPFSEWTNQVPTGVLHECKRCGQQVCDYVQNCFEFIPVFRPDSNTAPDTQLHHVFYNGEAWMASPVRQGQEAGWHSHLFETLCHQVEADLAWCKDYYLRRRKPMPLPAVVIVMPLSRSAIPLHCLISKVFRRHWKEGAVEVMLPMSTRGASFPIVHCIRHRRFTNEEDQYEGQQQNLMQEYINTTRARLKTTFWVEKQPFGTPTDFIHATHRFANGGTAEKHGYTYALKRGQHIVNRGLFWGILHNSQRIQDAYLTCFGQRLSPDSVDRVHDHAQRVLEDLRHNRMKDVPVMGQGRSDWNSLNEVIRDTLIKASTVSKFACQPTKELLGCGHDRRIQAYEIKKLHEKKMSKVDLYAWQSALRFGHVMLPGATAEISPAPDRGKTRLCFPFIQPSKAMNAEEAITSLCSLTRFLACMQDESLYTETRVQYVPHKAHVKEDNGQLWWRKSCKSSRMATAITAGNQDMCYMYLGGGAVDDVVSELIHGIVVICKTWKWAAFAHSAARIAGLTCANNVKAFSEDLVMPCGNTSQELTEDTRGDAQPSMQSATTAFIRECDRVWMRVAEKFRGCGLSPNETNSNSLQGSNDQAKSLSRKLEELRSKRTGTYKVV